MAGAMFFGATISQANVICVNDSATGNDTGGCWADAYVFLQDALNNADTLNKDADPNNDITEIWVASGTYYPDQGIGLVNDNEELSFVIPSGVKVYGSLLGTEDATDFNPPTLDDRGLDMMDPLDPTSPTEPTSILRGDIGQNTLPVPTNARSHHVVFTQNVGPGTRLDGFTIREGDSDCIGGSCGNSGRHGGGIAIDISTFELDNCVLRDNVADADGGGMHIRNSSELFAENTWFINNDAGRGGGLFVVKDSSSSLTDCVFANNDAEFDGGGMMVMDVGDQVLTNCRFLNNDTAAGDGGGLHIGDEQVDLLVIQGDESVFEGNDARQGRGGGLFVRGHEFILEETVFEDNQAGEGGGAYFGCRNTGCNTGVIRNCEFIDNSVRQNGTERGGGVFVHGGGFDDCCSNLDFIDCRFDENDALLGGGAYVSSHRPRFERCRFETNNAVENGGGVWASSKAEFQFQQALIPSFVNTLFAKNIAGDNGGGLYYDARIASGSAGDPLISLCTFAENIATALDGGGIHYDGFSTGVGPDINNTIIWDNEDRVGTNDETSQIFVTSTTPTTFNYNCIKDFDVLVGTGNINVDPQFRDPDGLLNADPLDDFYIGDVSPCIDAGDPAAVLTFDEDLEVDPRLANRTVDMGVDEFNVSCTRDCDCYLAAKTRADAASMVPSDVFDVCDYHYCDIPAGETEGFCTPCSRKWAQTCSMYNNVVETGDILCAVEGFGDYCACPNADITRNLSPGTVKGPTGIASGGVGTADILAIVDAFGGQNPFLCDEVSDDDKCDDETIPTASGCGTSGSSGSDASSSTWATAYNKESVNWTPHLFGGRSQREPQKGRRPGPSLELSPGTLGPFAASGSPVLQVDVFVSDIASVAGYEIRVQPSSGTVEDVVLESVEVDTSRADFLFTGVDHHATTDQNLGRIGGVGVLNSVSVPVQDSAYLGTFYFRVDSGDPSAVTFEYDSEFTALWNPNIVQIEVSQTGS